VATFLGHDKLSTQIYTRVSVGRHDGDLSLGSFARQLEHLGYNLTIRIEGERELQFCTCGWSLGVSCSERG